MLEATIDLPPETNFSKMEICYLSSREVQKCFAHMGNKIGLEKGIELDYNGFEGNISFWENEKSVLKRTIFF